MRKAFKTFAFGLIGNRLSLVGTAVALGAMVLIVSFLIIESLGLFHAGPYAGIITFVFLPLLFVLGLLLIPIGLVVDRRQRQRLQGDTARVPLFPSSISIA